jgi:hypothetical protein
MDRHPHLYVYTWLSTLGDKEDLLLSESSVTASHSTPKGRASLPVIIVIIARTNWAQVYWFLSLFSWKMEGTGEQSHFWPMTIQYRNRLDTVSAQLCWRCIQIVYRTDCIQGWSDVAPWSLS